MPPASFWTGKRSPLEGLDAIEQSTEVHWGREPKKLQYNVDVPALTRVQPLVKMGELRALWLTCTEDSVELLQPSKPYPLLTFGELDNRIYIAGGSTARMAKRREWGTPGTRREVLRIDYDAKKGNYRGTVYWYHDHEPPYPKLEVLANGFPAYRGGGYKIAREGIVG